VVGICVTLAIPTRQPVLVGGHARIVDIQPEPRRGDESHGHYLLLTASVRRITFAELLWRHVQEVAASVDPGSMAEARATAWAAVSEIVGPVLHVDAVRPGTPAAVADVREGDQLVAIDGEPPRTMAIDEAFASGHPVALRIVRAGVALDRLLVPTPPWPQPFLGGMTVHAEPLDGPAPAVDTGDVSGSSGGLVLALAELDLVTPGDLTRGRVVAATGELGPGGYVVPVLGYDEKVPAALRAGATVLVVPPDAGSYVRSIVPATVEVISVQTVRDAMAQLCIVGGTSSACGNAGFDPAPGH